MTTYRTSSPTPRVHLPVLLPRRPDRTALALALLGVVAARPGSASGTASHLADGVRAALARDPLLTIASVLPVAAGLFYRAEHGVNPKVRTYADALLYCSTSLSVGYHDVFPHTEAGKLVATVLHTLGPALAARALEPPTR